jgi:uncharacterized protein
MRPTIARSSAPSSATISPDRPAGRAGRCAGAIHAGPPRGRRPAPHHGRGPDGLPPRPEHLAHLAFRGKRVERILFAATKADHLHHTQHPAPDRDHGGPAARGARPRRFFRRPDRGDVDGLASAPRSRKTSPATAHDSPRARARFCPPASRPRCIPATLPADPARLLSPAREGAEPGWMPITPDGLRARPLTLAPAKARRISGWTAPSSS